MLFIERIVLVWSPFKLHSLRHLDDVTHDVVLCLSSKLHHLLPTEFSASSDGKSMFFTLKAMPTTGRSLSVCETIEWLRVFKNATLRKMECKRKEF